VESRLLVGACVFIRHAVASLNGEHHLWQSPPTSWTPKPLLPWASSMRCKSRLMQRPEKCEGLQGYPPLMTGNKRPSERRCSVPKITLRSQNWFRQSCCRHTDRRWWCCQGRAPVGVHPRTDRGGLRRRTEHGKRKPRRRGPARFGRDICGPTSRPKDAPSCGGATYRATKTRRPRTGGSHLLFAFVIFAGDTTGTGSPKRGPCAGDGRSTVIGKDAGVNQPSRKGFAKWGIPLVDLQDANLTRRHVANLQNVAPTEASLISLVCRALTAKLRRSPMLPAQLPIRLSREILSAWRDPAADGKAILIPVRVRRKLRCPRPTENRWGITFRLLLSIEDIWPPPA